MPGLPLQVSGPVVLHGAAAVWAFAVSIRIGCRGSCCFDPNWLASGRVADMRAKRLIKNVERLPGDENWTWTKPHTSLVTHYPTENS